MTLLFYLILVWVSNTVTFSWIWFIIALLFSLDGARTVYKYKYTNNPNLMDEDFEEVDENVE